MYILFVPTSICISIVQGIDKSLSSCYYEYAVYKCNIWLEEYRSLTHLICPPRLESQTESILPGLHNHTESGYLPVCSTN